MKNITFSLEGLQYKDTRDKVKNKLESLNGVHEVCMGINHKSVDINYDWPATDQEIKSCLDEHGFRVCENSEK